MSGNNTSTACVGLKVSEKSDWARASRLTANLVYIGFRFVGDS